MLKIYNTFTKQKEEFQPINPGKVGMYSCGPTVYDYVHIGNIKSYVNIDILRRYLEYAGYEVRMIRNITDVGHLTQDDIAQGDSGEDKISRKALAEKKTPEEIARFYEAYYREVEKEINLINANYYPRATAHVQQMINIIETLINKGFAYESNGNVFFDVTKFENYGKLSGNTLEQLKVGARLEEHPDKRNPWDFALWLKADEKHLMRWQAPWSIGYPGWHIECTAMSGEYLGNSFDIHTGGVDNIFPHHEAEIAQTESYSGQKFVKYWIHTQLLKVDGEKMSKSKGNFYTLEDLKEKGFSPMDVRLLIMSSHYRSPMNFTLEGLAQAHKNLQKINECMLTLESVASRENGIIEAIEVDNCRKKIEAAFDDDLNTPLALSHFYGLISEINILASEDKLSSKDAKKILSLWKRVNSVFGLILQGQAEIPQEIRDLVNQREKARKEKDFQKSDELRDLIKQKGFVVEDTKEGTKISNL